MKRLGIFVDVQNIYYTCRQQHQASFNYRALWSYLSERGDITVANAYAIARRDDQQIKFQDALRHIGFNVKLKPFIQRNDGTAKGDWDVGITIDIIDQAPVLDEVILLSGDGDFGMLLEHVKSKNNLTTTVVSVPALTARSLLEFTDNHITIDADSPFLK
ncbi:NYN domain-containing protein [Aliiglaciecola litoralis]|uniref:NYN domain-containing protein n=1 Tax=Aliiglaciecola litoralis TaxID=582857 RepID=A0ABN1LD73_9ALTE